MMDLEVIVRLKFPNAINKQDLEKEFEGSPRKYLDYLLVDEHLMSFVDEGFEIVSVGEWRRVKCAQCDRTVSVPESLPLEMMDQGAVALCWNCPLDFIQANPDRWVEPERRVVTTEALFLLNLLPRPVDNSVPTEV